MVRASAQQCEAMWRATEALLSEAVPAERQRRRADANDISDPGKALSATMACFVKLVMAQAPRCPALLLEFNESSRLQIELAFARL